MTSWPNGMDKVRARESSAHSTLFVVLPQFHPLSASLKRSWISACNVNSSICGRLHERRTRQDASKESTGCFRIATRTPQAKQQDASPFIHSDGLRWHLVLDGWPCARPVDSAVANHPRNCLLYSVCIVFCSLVLADEFVHSVAAGLCWINVDVTRLELPTVSRAFSRQTSARR